MKKCNCHEYEDITDSKSLQKRFKQTGSILENLRLIAKHKDEEHYLYECATCGQFWQRSLSWIDGNKQYIFKVPNVQIDIWIHTAFISPDELFGRNGVIRQYLENASFEEQEPICRHIECLHHTVKWSVFCVLHHMENIGIEFLLADDVIWFAPYDKEQCEVTYERISELSNYKKYEK